MYGWVKVLLFAGAVALLVFAVVTVIEFAFKFFSFLVAAVFIAVILYAIWKLAEATADNRRSD